MRSFAIAVLTPVQYRSQPLRGRCSSSKLRGLDKVEAMRRLSQPRLRADELAILDCRPMGCGNRQRAPTRALAGAEIATEPASGPALTTATRALRVAGTPVGGLPAGAVAQCTSAAMVVGSDPIDVLIWMVNSNSR